MVGITLKTDGSEDDLLIVNNGEEEMKENVVEAN